MPVSKKKKIDPHALVALLRRELKLPETPTVEFPTPCGEVPVTRGSAPDLDDDDLWPDVDEVE
jgi:hypothetical protein